MQGCRQWSAIKVGHERHHDRLVDVRGRGFGDVVGGFEGGSQLGHGGGWLAQGGDHEEEVVSAAVTGACGASHGLGGNFGGALGAGASPRGLAAQQGEETSVKLGGKKWQTIEKNKFKPYLAAGSLDFQLLLIHRSNLRKDAFLINLNFLWIQ